MRVLVTGGAGYVGSHVVRTLAEAGHRPHILDDFSEGHRAAVGRFPLTRGSILSAAALNRALKASRAQAVIHMAAKCLVEESVREPALYWRVNVTGGLLLLEAMARAKVGLMVFSSSAAVYGQPDCDVITENTPQHPCNPYGRTKLVYEHALSDAAAAGMIRFAALRYFNAAGAHSSGEIGEDHPVETHLVPNLLRAALSGGQPLRIYGTDYPTPDGTPVRDYIHVEDLAAAHVMALDYLSRGGESLSANLGTGRGSSIREVLDAARRVTGRDFPADEAPRRPGDPACLVASNQLAARKLGWSPRRSLDDVLASAWRWHSTHPRGYARRR